ncbi:MAG: cytochrome o ubiquinol oxidase subunit IV [Paracoccus sp. (in: a-proteobacteria)]|uniref:cytochrome o ubiquinol oxidase subunit IV n=1 Tax=unclassified Paracoccus (in: a-proteobacteria) TaxID=2688777 RepID=UPI000C3C42D2|nr:MULTISPECIES: cytochrome C oxidase subunit IV family protein [unclassified Paracoccus (in: a-proteobacteria)]MAN55241.1 cytochrome-c oxidase [Paracoccus sp. (in: a-proteobacteria)]MBA47883.1 cytochrome-c oxidase [Paracoccus sp. (in: a-proteobacteria)]MCS5603480.1 cytochrome C oxidase subunit IV family protein [Paracoccus sp. (in: a-proteobacteria)]HIC66327.1 cytochrome-c oxidase [Paracoccus sp. (in: a-proteobacteria)]|tara:strand:+ start:699 stop:1034 length:336 start_codon:yes stop_codon:yes gene_type:complete
MSDDRRGELRRYVRGFVVSAALTGLAFWAVAGSGLTRPSALWIVALAGIAQVAVQLRCFLHIGWRQQREDLHLIGFSLLLMGLMIGGTVWIMGSLGDRMQQQAETAAAPDR